MCVCVCCFVLLYRYWGIVTVPLSFLFRGPGGAGCSTLTLTTSLVTPVPSSSSSNGPSNYYVDNQGLVPWQQWKKCWHNFFRGKLRENLNSPLSRHSSRPQRKSLGRGGEYEKRSTKGFCKQYSTDQSVSKHDDDCFYYHSWRNDVVIAFGTLSSFLT